MPHPARARLAAKADAWPRAISSVGRGSYGTLGPDVADAETQVVVQGVTDVRAALLPQYKVGTVRETEQAGRKVLMVGDGVNDAATCAEHSTRQRPRMAVRQAVSSPLALSRPHFQATRCRMGERASEITSKA
ncbi:hypothetical protein [Streptomyces sp. NPDC047453]|uniref:hypothetical protein n=1 Tax=Streptomyces sp. NPDC047453 TaxID=3154812 RepID=UPI00340DB740